MAENLTFGIKLKADGSGFTGEIKMARAALEGLGDTAEKSGKQAAQGFGLARAGVQSISQQLEQAKNLAIGYFSVTQSIASARWILDQASAMQQLDARLKVATSSVAEYAKAQAGVFEIANRYGAAVNETASAVARLNPVIAQLGGGVGTTLRMVDGLAASLKLSGATAAETGSVLLQFSQAMGSGRVGGDEFRSMMEAAEPMMRAVAGQLGKTTAELRQMAEEGKLTSSVFGNALLPVIDKLAKQAAQIPLGIGQSWQVLQNNLKRDFGREFGDQANIAARAIKGMADHTTELSAAVHAAETAIVTLAEKSAIVAGGAGLGALMLTAGSTAAAFRAAAAAAGAFDASVALFVGGAALARLEKLSLASKSGLLGLTLWGSYEAAGFLVDVTKSRDAIGTLLEPIFRAYDRIAGDAGRKAQIGIEDARKQVDELKRLKAEGAKTVSVDTEVLGLSSKKTLSIDAAIADAEKSAQRLQAAYVQVYAAPARAGQDAAAKPTALLSSAGEYSKLTAELKWREKLVKDHQDKLLNLQDSYSAKWREAAEKDRPALERNHRAALDAMLRAQKSELEGLPGAKDGRDTLRARSDALIKQAEGGSKRATEFYKQELEQNRLAFADYVGAVEALQRNALTAKRGALASTLAGAVQPGDKERIKGQIEEIDRELADLPNQSSRSLEDYTEKWRARMRGIAAELSGTMSAADKARGEFVSRHTADIARAAAEGDAAALKVLGEVARASVAKGEFADAANEYKGVLNGVAAEIEAIKARAASGDLDAASALAGEKAIRDRAIPALDALIARLAELKAAAEDPAVAAQFGEMAKGFEQAKIAAQDAGFDDFWAGAKRGANDYLATSANVAKSSRDFFSRSFKSMEDAVTQFAMTGKLNLRDFANVAIQEFYRINLARPLVGALSGAFQGAAGSFGSLFSTSQAYGTNLFSQQTSMLAAQTAGMHSGGIVGQDATFNRHISPAHFDGAPRFHTGGIIGPGERPIIAQDGEEVLTRTDPRHRYNQRNAQAPETSGAVTLVYSPNIQIDARNAAPGMEQLIARVVGQAVEQSRASLMAEMGSGGQFALATGRRRR